MTVERIPGEDRFFVESQSGHQPYLVDLAYQENPWSRPKALCGCFQMFCKGEPTCKHVEAVVLVERRRLGL